MFPLSLIKSPPREVQQNQDPVEISKKIEEAVQYGTSASIYQEAEVERTTAQTVVISLFYGLLYGDVDFCRRLLKLEMPQLKSTFLRVWLRDDFLFSGHDVCAVLSMMSYLLETGRLVMPWHVVRIFGGLVRKYGMEECCTRELKTLFGPECDSYCCKLQEPSVAGIANYQAVGNTKLESNEESLHCSSRTEMCKIGRLNRSESSRLHPVRKKHIKRLFYDKNVKHKVNKNEVEDEGFASLSLEDSRDRETNPDDNDESKNQLNIKEDNEPFNTFFTDRQARTEGYENEQEKIDDEFHLEPRSYEENTRDYAIAKPSESSKYVQTTFHEIEDPSEYLGSKYLQTPYPQIADEEGRTLVHRLAQFGRTEALQRLLDEGADLEATDNSGRTALHWAAEYNHWATVRLLLSYGAKVNPRTKDGRTPLSLSPFKGGSVSQTWMIISENGGTV